MDADAGATEHTLLADRFDEMWRTNETAPDVFAFLEAHTAVTARERVDVLLTDQAHRWRTGDPIPAEMYLGKLPVIAADPELKLDLVFGEFHQALRTCSDPPDLKWFIARFPDLREALLRQAEVNDWWAGGGVSEEGADEDVGNAARDGSRRNHAAIRPKVGVSPPDQHSAQKLPPGLVLGDYQIKDQIGRGGMGEVYRALHLHLGREVALKVIVPPYLSSEKMTARFYREMKAVGRLDHPHLVRASDARQVGQRHILIMELLDGINLRTLVDRVGPLSVADACEVIRQAAEGSQHAHQHGIVHRDIKPANLMLIRGGTIKVLDLGLARLQEGEADGLTPSHLAIGTPDYVAPEQAADPRAASPRSDLYSLGCTLYHLLAGRPPFHGSKSPFDKMLSHQRAPIPPIRQRRPELPVGLAGLLDRMLAKDPMKRPSSAREMAESLLPWCVGADLPGLLERAYRSDPPESSPCTAIVDAASDGAADVAEAIALPSTAAYTPRRNEFPSVPVPVPDGGRAGHQRRSPPTWAMATALLLGLLAAWQFVVRPDLKGPASPIPASAQRPLMVTSLSVRHYRAHTDGRFDDLGLIGHSDEAVQVGDDVRIELVLSEPAYAYLLALNTNGKVQHCLPESDAQPPPCTDRLVLYPDSKDYFTLSEGPGVQALVAVASRRPLPAYRDWRLDADAAHWSHTEATGVWRYDGGQFAPEFPSGLGWGSGTRGTKTRRVPERFVQACQYLRGRSGVDAIGAIAFPVIPSDAKASGH